MKPASEIWQQAEEWHDKAMWYLDQIEIAKLSNLDNDVDALLKDALYYELDAAMLLDGHNNTEPSRPILFDSAANIAGRMGNTNLEVVIRRVSEFENLE